MYYYFDYKSDEIGNNILSQPLSTPFKSVQKTAMPITNGWLEGAEKIPSPHCDARPDSTAVSLLVVHNISLPPGEFGGHYISDLFLGQLDKNAHPYFSTIYKLKVSAHCLIQRNGHIIQFVSFNDRAWHA